MEIGGSLSSVLCVRDEDTIWKKIKIQRPNSMRKDTLLILNQYIISN